MCVCVCLCVYLSIWMCTKAPNLSNQGSKTGSQTRPFIRAELFIRYSLWKSAFKAPATICLLQTPSLILFMLSVLLVFDDFFFKITHTVFVLIF